MRVAFIGPVGSGKSTQAQRLSWTMPFYNRCQRLSTGDLVRAQIEARTPLGEKIEAYHDGGEPVPDGVVLYDFPATVTQAEALDVELEERSAGPLHHVISLEGPTDDELVGRVLSGRVHGRATDFVCHLKNNPPPKAGERLDAGPFERRGDDTEDVLRRRLGTYRREHALLKERYEEQGILTVVDARRSLDDVAEDVLDALGHPEGQQYHVS